MRSWFWYNAADGRSVTAAQDRLDRASRKWQETHLIPWKFHEMATGCRDKHIHHIPGCFLRMSEDARQFRHWLTDMSITQSPRWFYFPRPHSTIGRLVNLGYICKPGGRDWRSSNFPKGLIGIMGSLRRVKQIVYSYYTWLVLRTFVCLDQPYDVSPRAMVSPITSSLSFCSFGRPYSPRTVKYVLGKWNPRPRCGGPYGTHRNAQLLESHAPGWRCVFFGPSWTFFFNERFKVKKMLV